jgi:hypothetical protein
MQQFFEQTEQHPRMREQMIANTVKEFTGYFFKLGKLATHNPYTGKYEALNIENFGHVLDADALMKDMSMLHKTRIRMLEQSRKRILALSKKKLRTRDNDLEASVEVPKSQMDQRLMELDQSKVSDKDKGLER